MKPLSVPEKAIKAVSQSFVRSSDLNMVHSDYLYVVWSVKVLQNWKALVSTDVVGGLYWEVTYDGDQAVTYVDQYEKKGQVIL